MSSRTSTRTHPALERFVSAVRSVVDGGGTEREITDAVADRLRTLVDHGAALVPPGMRRPRADSYAMYPLHVAADGTFSVAAAVWGVGQVTPIHDHGTWGVIGILEGIEREHRYDRPDPEADAPPTLLDERFLGPGDVEVCCTSDQDVHEVACASPIPTLALHVYGADIGTLERHAFDPNTGAARTFVSRWAEPAT